ncbi:MAG: hypothetical protein IJ719_22590 [Clostridia bacterium]|nr:hypothetical protein [Clostridia bacterium]
MKSRLKFIFVHGLSGWGSYDAAYARMPYWGMRGGDLMVYLRDQGFDCYAASVAPTGSAWDRACELYAQIAGTKVDYGQAHSEIMRHNRFGKDFTAHPLIGKWNEETRLVLLGHSFGGATVRLFAKLLAHGDERERGTSQTASPFFMGGMGDRVHGIVTLAAPMNGTTAYDLFTDSAFEPAGIQVPLWSKGLARMMSMGTKPKRDGRDERDYADHDMHIDHALEMNAGMPLNGSTYYFSVPCSMTKCAEDGCHKPQKGIEPLFVMRATQIGAYTGKTKGGYVIDERWRENDGLVNTISASAPIGDPSKALDRENIERGIWNVFPVLNGDRMWLQGGLLHRHDIRAFYLDLLSMIAELE